MIGRVSTKFGLTRRLDDTKVEHGGSLSSGHDAKFFLPLVQPIHKTVMMPVLVILFFATECTSIEHKGPRRGNL